ncbi:MAG TPA: enoyl-CoA hydratase/isomerase family protein [Mycobacterium sp.]|nr:enoyl-CoA hydratase/isomerase family protein [Mycobacterium sp.]
MSQLAHHIDRARVDNEVRALVITGSGRAFCAGGDLTVARELAEMDPPCGQQFLIDFAVGRVARAAGPVCAVGKTVVTTI